MAKVVQFKNQTSGLIDLLFAASRLSGEEQLAKLSEACTFEHELFGDCDVTYAFLEASNLVDAFEAWEDAHFEGGKS
jgi:hypothetical protein